MKSLKVVLFIQFLFFLVYAVLNILFPDWVAKAKMGPEDALSALYNGATYLALSLAAFYAFRNPVKNIAIVKVIILGDLLAALVGLYSGITHTQDTTWSNALFSIIVGLVLALGLLITYPRGEKSA